MGEYGIRNTDKAEIKIGTCETNLYMRYGDRWKVTPKAGSGFGYFWRLPYPDEDGVKPGDYDNPFRGERLYRKVEENGREYTEQFTLELAHDDKPGNMQLTHPSGLLMNVPCYHGQRLPEPGPESHIAWNGKSWFYELAFLREYEGKIYPAVKCRFCEMLWRCDWDEVMPFVNGELKNRLQKYVS